MVKLVHNLALLILITYSINCIEPQNPQIVQPKNIKIYVEDKTEKIDASEIQKDDTILEAKPVEQVEPAKIEDRILNDKVFHFPDQSEVVEQNEQPTYRHRLFIFRIFPNFGGETDPDNKPIEKKLLGGGGENDPDTIRFKLDDDVRNVMTGQDDQMMSMMAHRWSMHSMMESIKNMFNLMENGNSDEEEDSTKHLPFVIRTDDGNEAIIPNDLGDENRMKENKNCMMLSFMRLKASIYYRTILHLLFFTGILLFILSMIMITFRTFRKKRYSTLRYMPHNMDVSSIDSGLEKEKNSWYEITSDRTTLIRGPDNSVVLIQAPPAYDQVIVGDASRLIDDKADTKSLPPGYDVINEKN